MRAGTSLTTDAEVLIEPRSPQNTLYAARIITTMVKMLTATAMTAAHHLAVAYLMGNHCRSVRQLFPQPA